MLHNKDGEFSRGTGKPCGLDHKELKFPVPVESVGIIARYLELGVPPCCPVDGANADFSYHRFNEDIVTKIYE